MTSTAESSCPHGVVEGRTDELERLRQLFRTEGDTQEKRGADASAAMSDDVSMPDEEAVTDAVVLRQSLGDGAGAVAITAEDTVAVAEALADETLAGASAAGALEVVEVLVTIPTASVVE
ncbi:hypothetical protein CCR75_002715 [Bremia lactucae]|uniref:Uncharacterized protein n=1 Tax=Bremia lactucae TaxID=4779 RepID=A0A976FQZ7_BRELC|nr:hypothetical protein CCR75_002715 [Bremia lactucae]